MTLAFEIQGWTLAIILIVLLSWLWSVVAVATTKTEDPYDRIVWLLIVLILNMVGTLLYCLYGPEKKQKKDDLVRSEEDLKRRVNGPGNM